MGRHLAHGFSKTHLLLCCIQWSYQASDSHLPLKRKTFSRDLIKIKVMIHIMHVERKICPFLVSEKFPKYAIKPF